MCPKLVIVSNTDAILIPDSFHPLHREDHGFGGFFYRRRSEGAGLIAYISEGRCNPNRREIATSSHRPNGSAEGGGSRVIVDCDGPGMAEIDRASPTRLLLPAAPPSESGPVINLAVA